MELKLIKTAFRKEALRIPSFINKSDPNEMELTEYFLGILQNISELIQDDYLSDRRIKYTTKLCNSFMDSIELYLVGDHRRYILVCSYILAYLEDLNDLLLDSEHFESVVNLKKFNDGFHNVKKEL